MISVDRLQDHSFFSSELTPGGVVVDLGANAGRFAQLISGRYGVRCVCFEPNPAMFDRIPSLPSIEKYQMAASGRSETVRFYVDQNSEASSIRADDDRPGRVQIEVEAEPLARILKIAGAERVQLLKVDIEGAETDFFASAEDSDLKRIDQIAVEFHEMHGWTDKADIFRFFSRMQQLGFVYLRMSVTHYGDVLFLNRDHFGASRIADMTTVARKFRRQRVLNSAIRRVFPRFSVGLPNANK